jgi:hypothetical protein
MHLPIGRLVVPSMTASLNSKRCVFTDNGAFERFPKHDQTKHSCYPVSFWNGEDMLNFMCLQVGFKREHPDKYQYISNILMGNE